MSAILRRAFRLPERLFGGEARRQPAEERLDDFRARDEIVALTDFCAQFVDDDISFFRHEIEKVAQRFIPLRLCDWGARGFRRLADREPVAQVCVDGGFGLARGYLHVRDTIGRGLALVKGGLVTHGQVRPDSHFRWSIAPRASYNLVKLVTMPKRRAHTA